ncbi:MAG: Spi family protease inhibitor [Prevotella sp.]|nr:Spi family protease inhibitor [Prevotella sp.]
MKRQLLLFVLVLMTAGVWAQQISEEQARDRALPVLGYSATGSIDWDRMPDNMRAWLKSYDQAMATLGNTKEFADGVSIHAQKTRAPRKAIAPLLKTQWDQMEPHCGHPVPLMPLD